MNTATFGGKVTWIKEPEVDSRPITFGLAVNEGRDKTLWVKVAAFGKTKEFVERWFRKGAAVTVTGRVQFDPETGNPRAWLNKDDRPTTALEVTADRVTLHTWPDEIGEDTDSDDDPEALRDDPLADIPF
jgi:single-stranded DNA-binding protein